MIQRVFLITSRTLCYVVEKAHKPGEKNMHVKVRGIFLAMFLVAMAGAAQADLVIPLVVMPCRSVRWRNIHYGELSWPD